MRDKVQYTGFMVDLNSWRREIIEVAADLAEAADDISEDSFFKVLTVIEDGLAALKEVREDPDITYGKIEENLGLAADTPSMAKSLLNRALGL